MPIIQENPTYFSDKPTSDAVAAAAALNSSSISTEDFRSYHPKPYQISRNQHGATRKHSMTSSYEDGHESPCEMETFLSSYESGNSYSAPETKIIRNNSCKTTYPKYNAHSLKKSKGKHGGEENQPASSSSSSGIGSLGRLSQLFKKSKSKSSVGSGESTVDSSGIGSPTTCTPDSSLSIYTNSLDGDSHSSTNSNQISPKLTGSRKDPIMDDRFGSTYTFDDCGIYAANMYYNVGESSVFTIYHPNNNQSKNANNFNPMRPINGDSGRFKDDDEFEDCVQPYYNNASFSTFSNPKRCSVASAASTTTSSIVPVAIPPKRNFSNKSSLSKTTTSSTTILQDGDGYLKPNEPTCNKRSTRNKYANDSVIAEHLNTANNNTSGQVQQVQVDVHTPTYPSVSAYQFDSASSTASQATTLTAGGSGRIFRYPPIGSVADDKSIYGDNGNRRRNGGVPIYMNKAYFGSNSIGSSSASSSDGSGVGGRKKNLPGSSSIASDCEPYCSLCSSSIMGSPRKQFRMDVAIVKCKECFFSREAEAHIRGFFDKLMTKDKQKLDVTLKSYDLKDLDHPTDRVVVHCAKVQIVIISHHFLQRLKDEATRKPRLSPVNRVFRSKNVICVLLAVSAQEVLDGYESVLPRFREWFSVDLRSTNKYDPEFCKRFTEQVVRIYTVELSNSSSFSIFPKKVTREQPKIAIVLKKPVSQDEDVKIELKAHGHSVILSDVKFENPHTILLRIPENLSPDVSAIVDVSVYINAKKIGGSRIKSELNQLRVEDDEIDRMAKTLPPFLGWLDQYIANTLLKHYKECTDYTSDPDLELMNGIIICKADIMPTILHFAAYYGLQQTTLAVLEEADGLSHCNVRNDLNEKPSDIAFSRGHEQVGQMIGEYQEISELSTAYRFLKDMMENESEPLKTDADVEKQLDYAEFDSEEVFEDMSQQPSTQVLEEAKSVEDKQEENEILPSAQLEDKETPSPTMLESTEEVPPKVFPKKPTPTPTARRKNNVLCGREYVNVDGNPRDNPEHVQTREKRNAMSPETLRKRLSIMQNYDLPRTVNEDYKVPPPEVRPVLREDSVPEENVSSPVFKRKHSGKNVTSSGYLIIDEDGLDGSGLLKGYEQVDAVLDTEVTDSKTSGKSEATQKPSLEKSQTSESVRPNLQNCKKENNKVQLDRADEQLIQLLNDFKNNTIDIRMVELLFEGWKMRPDVQKSMEERVKVLEQLREEYRKLKPQKGSKKTSILDGFKTIWRRKKSSTTKPPEILYPGREYSPPCVTSPTALTFTGPNLSYQTSSHVTLPSSSTPVVQPSQPIEANFDFRASESSYRTSIDSRFSDSSVESEKPSSSLSSTGSGKNVPQAPLEYRNPLCQRFIPTYVGPNPSQPTSDSEDCALKSPTPSNFSYEVPPPPRPVKPLRLSPSNAEDIKPSPKPPRKPPVIPEEEVLPSPNLKRKPPPIPINDSKQYEEEITSPPPMPPPRTANLPPSKCNYIDYKKKCETGGANPEGAKQSYENMSEHTLKDN